MVPREGIDLNLVFFTKMMWEKWNDYALSLGYDEETAAGFADRMTGGDMLSYRLRYPKQNPKCEECGGDMEVIEGSCSYCPPCMRKGLEITPEMKLHLERLVLWQEASKLSTIRLP